MTVTCTYKAKEGVAQSPCLLEKIPLQGHQQPRWVSPFTPDSDVLKPHTHTCSRSCGSQRGQPAPNQAALASATVSLSSAVGRHLLAHPGTGVTARC